ncbi:hypothetical protein IV38_GL000713 [Lactobacillus selangorensis]|uniref:Uncharacterized protein n=1 Tax=Lactobacillus selangorensis TaxID=81857 RepID=A0A0R2FMQ3_9LACO|nr:O-antigen ligase family protein [Lactobacillus selangorensis]KRN27221.1 hypothetical protein IV38_GL000713 [Lactobacillus selangorensis]KRN29857.1 hypothetical protein IV40_GL000565 [Lactobacillus selangorensis]
MQKSLRRLFVGFILIQPFLDIYYLYQPPITTWFKFSPSTIIRIVLIAIVAVLFLITHHSRRLDLFLVGYALILGVYFIFHTINAAQVHTYTPGNFNYSMVSELFYLIRMVIPLFVIILGYHIELSRTVIENITRGLVLLVSGSIVILNLFTFSLASYGDQIHGGTNSWITGNIFTWFSNNGSWSYFNLASKGLFYYANATSAIELLLAPLIFYYLLVDTEWKNIVLAVFQTLAMLMLGTKAAALGLALTFAFVVVAYLFFAFIRKEISFNWRPFVVLLLLGVMAVAIMPHSPALNRTSFDAQTTQERHKKEKKDNSVKELKYLMHHKNRKNLVRYIKRNYPKYSINPYFITKAYPYKDDPYFWWGVMNWPVQDRLNNRKTEQAMLERVKQIDNRKSDDWLGIGYIRMNNIANLERDFVSQYYSMGYIGAFLLLAPYVLAIIYMVYRLLRYWRELLTMRNTMFAGSVTMMVGLSFYSGNVMDFLGASILLGFYMGYTLRILTHNEQRHPQLNFNHR